MNSLPTKEEIEKETGQPLPENILIEEVAELPSPAEEMRGGFIIKFIGWVRGKIQVFAKTWQGQVVAVYLFLQGTIGLPLPSLYDVTVVSFDAFQKYAPLVYRTLDESDPQYLVVLPKGDNRIIDDRRKIPSEIPKETMIIPASGESSGEIELG